jgi:polyribonucleotide nucleotidyltransferase
MSVIRKETNIGETKISFETGRLAPQALSSILAQMGDTVVLATVVTREPKEYTNFFPLTVEYLEKLYASGIISSSRFIKREGRPSTDEILKARIIDRSIRPLFKEDFRNEVQLVVNVLSYDKKNDPGILAVNAASLALMCAGIPFEGPVSAVIVGMDENKNLILNPENNSEYNYSLELTISGTKTSITMIEAGSDSIVESDMIKAIEFAQSNIQKINKLQDEFLDELKPSKLEYKPTIINEKLLKEIKESFYKDIEKSIWEKEDRKLKEKIHEKLPEEYDGNEIEEAIEHLMKESAREGILKRKIRPDKRGFDEIRKLYIDIDILPRTHGSAIFQRGETQILSVATLGPLKQQQTIESIDGEETKRYLHHYNFPGWSVGELSRNLYYPGRRDIGHGALAERALERQIPPADEFPYAIRVVSETLSSNGSSSMASVCGSTLSLMAAGVKIKNPVAGIAMGLVMDKNNRDYIILTDIQGPEDHFGDMDFKVAGTYQGITALQMDNKLKGISIDILKEALDKAKIAREYILGEMLKVIDKSRDNISQYAPQIERIKIKPEKIGELIGPGGKMIKDIIEKSGAEIDINDEGIVYIASVSKESRDKAIELILDTVQDAEIGKIYKGKIAKVTTFGAFVNVSKSISGLIHVSEMSDEFVKDPNKIVKEGQEVYVKLIGSDDQGKLKFSMKQAKKD